MDLRQGLLLFVILLIFPAVESQCTFPTDMVTTGDWLTSTRGTWHVESSLIHNFTVNIKQDGTTDVYSFECFNQTTEGYYIIKSTTEVQPFGGGTNYNIYVCLNLDVASSTKLKYYLLSEEFQVSLPPNPLFERLIYVLSSSAPTSNDQICDDKGTYTNQERLHVAVAKNNAAGATTSFPCDFQAPYSYHSAVAACSSSYLDICESSVSFNYSLCPEAQMFSMNGSLSLIFSGSSVSGNTTTYTTFLYNNDSVTPDGTTYYTFICMLFAVTTNLAGTQIALSVNPTVCLSTSAQTSTYVTGSSGANITLTNLGTSTCADPICATTTTSTTTVSTSTTATVTTTAAVAAASVEWIYIVIVLIVILLIILIIIIICCCIRKRGSKKVAIDEEAPIADEKDDEEDEGKGSDKENEEDEEKGKSRPSTSKKYIEQEEDKKSIDSGFNGGTEDVSPVPAGVLAGDEEENNDKDDEENEITKFIAEEPEREDETLNKDENDEEEPVVKEEEEEEILNEDDKDGNETVVTDDEEEEPKVIAIEKGGESTDEEEENEEEDEEKEDKSHVEEEEQTEEKHDDADDEKSDTEDEEEKEEKDEDGQNEQENTEEDTKSVVIITKEAEETIDNTEEKKEEPPKEEKEEEKTDEEVKQEQQPSGIPVDEMQSRKEEEKEEEKDKTEDDDEEENEKKKQRENGESGDDEVDEDGNPIRIGMKKRKKFEPKGQLTNVLVTRDMEEKNRNKSRSKKKKGGIMKLFAKGKSKKFGEKRDSSADSQDEEKRRREGGGIRAEFMIQYEHKKNIEKKLDEQHYWSDEKEDFKYDDDFDFNDEQHTENNVAPADTVDDQTKGKEQTDDKQKEQKGKTDGKAGDGEKDLKDGKDATAKQGLTLDQKEKTGLSDIPDLPEDDKKRENGKDSGMETGGESPDPKKDPKQNANKGIVGVTDDEDVSTDDLENMYSDSDDDMFELPPGLIRDSEGRIIRESDGHVVSDHITEREYKKARLGRLFNIPRLKRSKKGRPVGGYIQDNYGPKVDEKLGENEDGPVLKHRRHSNGLPVMTDLATTNSGGKSGKSVMFDMDDNELPLPGVDIKDNGTKDRRSVSSACRKLLKKRLFKQKRKQGKGGHIIQVGSANDNPRELNDLVKVYGRPSAFDGQQIPGQPTSNYSKQVKLMDQDQIARNREGLARDKHILEKLQTTDTRGKAPFVPREAFMGQSDNIIEEISLENESIGPDGGRRDSVDIGDEDEFFWVGKGGQQQEALFTKVNHPRFNNGGIGLETQKSFDISSLRHDHEKRHTIPWSLIHHHGSNRELTGTDLIRSQDIGVSKSAGASREKIDDRRLRELLEELYRDKKYFDHVVETTHNEEKTEIDERFLAEHGRDYLLDRAEFWEGRQPLPPHRPPATALGLRLSRLQTNLDSGRMSMTSNTSSQIPQNGNTNIPGQVGNSENATENEQSSNDNSNNNSTSNINDENKENITSENKKITDIVTDANNT